MSDPALAWLAASAAAVVVLVPGYALWLRRLSRATPAPGGAEALPGSAVEAREALPVEPRTDALDEPASASGVAVEIVVAVRDEADWIEEKLRDLAALDSPPGGVAFWIVDGASVDATPEIVARWAERDPRFRLLRTAVGDKIAQLNAVLRILRAPWVMVTDADARLAPDTVTALLGAVEAEPLLAVVGVPVEPASAHPLERLHWRSLNRLRRAESGRGCAAIVTGPCYLFRRELLPHGFPADVVADDVHVAFTGAAAGRRVGFVDRMAVELRSPRTLVALFRHKVRKAEAYLREVVRFLPAARRLTPPARGVFLWRAAQMLLFPFAMAAGAAALAATAASAEPTHLASAAAAVAVALALDAALAAARRRPARLVPGAALGALLAAVLLVALVGLPFSRRTAAYPKIAGARPARGVAA